MGFIIAYILQTQVCIHVKLWFLVFMLLLGILGYLLVEYCVKMEENCRSAMENKLNIK